MRSIHRVENGEPTVRLDMLSESSARWAWSSRCVAGVVNEPRRLLGSEEIGKLQRVDERTREYQFRYLQTDRADLAVAADPDRAVHPGRSRPFFEALLPEGAVREQIAA